MRKVLEVLFVALFFAGLTLTGKLILDAIPKDHPRVRSADMHYLPAREVMFQETGKLIEI